MLQKEPQEASVKFLEHLSQLINDDPNESISSLLTQKYPVAIDEDDLKAISIASCLEITMLTLHMCQFYYN
jgi:hypothetical protein